MKSVWEKDANSIKFNPLRGNKNTDVLIIGGGIAGILCAYKFKKSGADCILAEATEICNGITKNTTAKITLQHGLIYDKLIKCFGKQKASLYLKTQIKACEEYHNICGNIDCNNEVKDSYIYSVNDRNKIIREVEALNNLGFDAEFSDTAELRLRLRGRFGLKIRRSFIP